VATYRERREARVERLRGWAVADALLPGPGLPDADLDELESLRAVALAARLPRNTTIALAKHFRGEWVAIPREDFDALRSALDAAKEAAPAPPKPTHCCGQAECDDCASCREYRSAKEADRDR
jgi:hypothetical protein